MDGTVGTRVLVATEPRAYREVMAGALQELRPSAEILLVEPDDLEAALTLMRPRLVVSSRSVETLRDCPLAWVVVYPNGETTALICVNGRRTTLGDLPFERLLSVVDDAAGLAGSI